jgi:NAD(P)-dependent dehydrogenase (short-subunit alcohol dehydrogenase family)
MDASEPQPPFPKQKQTAPGLESELNPRPRYMAPKYKPAGKLEGKRALVTGGDSGIGRADIAITYMAEELKDAKETKKVVEACGRRCVIIEGDLSIPEFCKAAIDRTVKDLGGIDILVSNAAHQTRKEKLDEISTEEWEYTFRTNIEAYFHLAKFAVPYMKPGSAIIATSSETAIFGNKTLLDYSSTKGAIDAFTRSLAQNLLEKGIRVNAVAPGPVWTPLNPSDAGQSADKIKTFGQDTPMGRPAQPEEIAPAYVFLASNADSSYITGIVLPELGGETVH